MFPQASERATANEGFFGPMNAPQKGVINNLVVFIRFSDEEEFTENITTYESLFNTASAGANSMRNYYAEASYNKLAISSTFYPTPGTTIVSYKDTQPRSYYRPYNAAANPNGYTDYDSRTVREHTLLKRAVDAISALVPSSLVIDGDNDGYVDNICFIVKGGVDGWNNLLWPHYWQLYSQTAMINGKRVSNFNFQLQDALAISGVGVLCHEMFHSIGAPDLYHYSQDALDPVGNWDLMDANSNPPQHMGAYMKMRYGGWISSIPRITTTGTYSLTPLQTSTSAYIIPSLCSSSEYFVVEYRKKSGTFEASLPGEGLLVYRINSVVDDSSGNRNGPPDEVYVYRPGGTAQVKGEPDNAAYSSTAGRTQINDSTSPSSFLANGGVGCLNLSNVGALGNTLSFDVTVGAEKTVSNSIGARNLVKITDRSGTLSSSGAAVTVKAWDANGNELSASGDVSPLTVANFATLSVSGSVLANRFPTGTPVVYEFTVASPKYIITNVKSSSDDTINIPYAYTNGTTTFVTNTVGSRNTIKITDMSGSLSASGGTISVNAWDVSGTSLPESAGAVPLKIYSNKTTTISGADLTARFSSGTPMTYEFVIGDTSKYIITNVKSSSDGTINIPYVYKEVPNFVSNSIGFRNSLRITDMSSAIESSGADITVNAWDANGTLLQASANAVPLKLYNNGTTTVSGVDLAARFPTATPMTYEISVAATTYIITNIKSSADGSVNIPYPYANGTTGYATNYINAYSTLKVTDMSGALAATGATINVNAWDAGGKWLTESEYAPALKIYNNRTTIMTGADLMARFPTATPVKYGFSVESSKYIITNLTGNASGTINVPSTYTNGVAGGI